MQYNAPTNGIVERLSSHFVPHQRCLSLIGHSHRWQKNNIHVNVAPTHTHSFLSGVVNSYLFLILSNYRCVCLWLTSPFKVRRSILGTVAACVQAVAHLWCWRCRCWVDRVSHKCSPCTHRQSALSPWGPPPPTWLKHTCELRELNDHSELQDMSLRHKYFKT